MNFRKFSRAALAFSLVIALAACGTRGDRGSGTSSGGGYYKVGKPYQIKGAWYYPKEDYSYDETGIASWYGADFHQLKTANGETYNKNELTAAHKTLPMPSLARVTNLENGRSIVVRVNDRGPFSGARVIDVSQRAAQLLGFEKAGTAKVRVQVLADESKAIADAMRTYGTSPNTQPQVASVTDIPVQEAGYTSAGSPSVEVMPLDGSGTPLPQTQMAQAQQAVPQATPFGKPSAPLTMANVRPVQEVIQMPVTGANNIYVQAGAFTNRANAVRLQTALAKTGSVNVVEAVVKGVQYYRVRVGPIDTVAKADQTLKKVLQSGADNARIIVD